MVDIQWPQVAVGVLFGGAAGATLRLAYDRWTARIQPVSYRVSQDSIFSSVPNTGALTAAARVEHEGQSYDFDDLTLVRVEITNRGNRDIDCFRFGITFTNGHFVLLADSNGADRHHACREIDTKATPNTPLEGLDFECIPFNRRDSYIVRLYVRNNGAITLAHVRLSTAAPVRFIEAQPAGEYRVMTIVFSFVVVSTIAAALSFFLGERTGQTERRVHQLETRIMDLESKIQNASQRNQQKARGNNAPASPE